MIEILFWCRAAFADIITVEKKYTANNLIRVNRLGK